MQIKFKKRLVAVALLVIIAADIAVIATYNNPKAEEFNVKSFLNNTYLTIGVAKKIDETTIYYYKEGSTITVKGRDALTARIELYYHFDSCFKLGISHHSQWSEGKPFNTRGEYTKTEIYLDCTISLGELF